MFKRIPLRRVFLLAIAIFILFCIYTWSMLPGGGGAIKQTQCITLIGGETKQFWRNCHVGRTGHRLAIVVPFRERFNQLLRFVPHIDSFLHRQGICYRLYVINQVDKHRFNRGMLINVGFLLSYNESTYMAMHDVDLLPMNEHLSYQYPTEGPFHLSAPNLHPKYHYAKFVGGILLIQNQHFAQVNGFSTKYWGWGLEDDEFYTRLNASKLVINRPRHILTGTSNSFLHLHDSTEHKRDTAKLFEQAKVTRKKDHTVGLNTTKFSLSQVHHLIVEGVPFCVFDVKLHCDHSITPWCKRPISSSVAATVH